MSKLRDILFDLFQLILGIIAFSFFMLFASFVGLAFAELLRLISGAR